MGLVEVGALLRIPNLEEDDYWNRGDATIIYCGELQALDQLSHHLRCRFNDQLDAHDDPRGILFFISEHFEPKGQSYDALIAEVGGDKITNDMSIEREQKIRSICDGLHDHWDIFNYLPCWSPIVGEDHIPHKYSQAAPGTANEMIYALMRQEGWAGEVIARSMWMMVWSKHRKPKFSKSNIIPPGLQNQTDDVITSSNKKNSNVSEDVGKSELNEDIEWDLSDLKSKFNELAEFMSDYEQQEIQRAQEFDWQNQVNEIADLMGKNFATELEARMIAEAKKA